MRKPLAEEDYLHISCEILTFVCENADKGFLMNACMLRIRSPADYMAAYADYNKEVINHG